MSDLARPWSDEETARLRRLVMEHGSWAAIASRMSRSPATIRKYAGKLGLKPARAEGRVIAGRAVTLHIPVSDAAFKRLASICLKRGRPYSDLLGAAIEAMVFDDLIDAVIDNRRKPT